MWQGCGRGVVGGVEGGGVCVGIVRGRVLFVHHAFFTIKNAHLLNYNVFVLPYCWY